jgi:transglutaminase-like putative cysteine protease
VVAGAIAALLLLGLVVVSVEDWQVRIRLLRRFSLRLDFRDTWTLLGLVIVLGWASATALDRAGWVGGSDRLISAFLFSVLAAWLLTLMGARLAVYLVLAVAAIPSVVLLTLPQRIEGKAAALPLQALTSWPVSLIRQPRLAILIGLLALMVVAAFWTAWWTFRRHNGLVALLPTGTIIAVEILNDPSTGLYFFALLWLAAAAMLLLRLNFVTLKQRWRSRRVPRAADSGWTFGEIGFEATVALLLLAMLLPPLSSQDISAFFVPGSVNTQDFHPFGLGSTNTPLGAGTIGYSETVRPGSALKAKPQIVMVVGGDASPFYPYWRGIALGGWDGVQWYQLTTGPDYPVRVQPRLDPGQSVQREDLPADASVVQVRNNFQMRLPAGHTNSAVFSAGEVITVEKHPWSVRGIMVTGPPVLAGTVGTTNLLTIPSAERAGGLPFDTVDLPRLIDSPRGFYDYTVTSAISQADVKSLRAAAVNYPAWLQPYREVYARGRIVATPARDAEVAALAARIVRQAGARNPYDMAKAIESYFRDSNLFTYTLDPKVPTGQKPLDYFLFESRSGYCQDFSTAMAVMLRTLHIPVRQMSGYATGSPEEKTHRIFVNSTDAHSWVEVFFPGYGWIPFEPTPDGQNLPVTRPLTAAELTDTQPGGVQATAKPRPDLAEPLAPGADGGSGWLSPLSQALWVAGGLLLLLLLALLAMWRWLAGANDAPRIWRRLLFLSDRLHVPRRPGDTPNELGARLASTLPELGSELRVIARLHTRSRYRRGGLGAADQVELKRSWSRVRRDYPSVLARAIRANLRNGAVRKEEASRSGSRGQPGRR